jgi:hypothetical protein
MTEADRKRSTVSCPAVDYPMGSIGGLSSGRSTPNLASVGLTGQNNHHHGGHPRAGSRGGSSSRDYGSEPDLRDVGMVEPCHPGNCPILSRNQSPMDDSRSAVLSESPLPNSFTLISESPAKKQIRSRKKSKAPAPPPACCISPVEMMGVHHPNGPVSPGAAYMIHHNGGANGHHSPMQVMYPPMPQPYILQQRHFLPDEGNNKKKLRLFKTKAESKSAANSPAIRSPPSSELIFPIHQQNGHNNNSKNSQFGGGRGGPMRASLDANRLLSAKERSSSSSSAQMNFIPRPSSSQMIERESKMMMGSSNKVEAKKVVAVVEMNGSGRKASSSSGNNKGASSSTSNAMISNGRLTSSSGGPLCSPKEIQPSSTTNNNSTTAKNNVEGNPKRMIMGSHAQGASPVPVNGSSNASGSGSGGGSRQQVPNNNQQGNKKGKAPLVHKNSNMNDESHDEKKTFYFGMDMGTFKYNKDQQQQLQQLQQNKQNAAKNSKAISGVPTPPQLTEDLHKEISRRKMVRQIEDEIKEESNSKAQMKNKNVGQNVQAQVKVPLNKKSSNNLRSESDSDGLHRRQDSGNFELNDKPKAKTSGQNGRNQNQQRPGESSSDLSSSDLDVPLVVTRPTLPQKRPDLPRFSPTAAWRALDSPSRVSVSGRSYSSEDGLNGGRIQGYSRPSAPPRISQERSGDSGISAGDAGSPANPIALASEDFSSSSPILNMPHSNNKKGNKTAADRMMKCWVPEQDLDESSSDFEGEIAVIPPPPPLEASGAVSPAPPKFTINSSSSRLFEGKRASAVVSDSDSKYFSSSGGGGGELNESNSSNNRRFYSRSTKSKEQQQQMQQRFSNQGIGPGAKYSGSGGKMRKSSNHQAPSNSNGFVGLDTNWFLSRSEPNSLHVLGSLEHQRDEVAVMGRFSGKNKQSREVIIGRKKRMPKNEQDDDDDEFECELHLSDEEESSDNNNNNDFNRNKKRNGNNTNIKTSLATPAINATPSGSKKNKGIESTTTIATSAEIGYGPSNMNFMNRSRLKNYEDEEEEVDYEDFSEEEEEDDDGKTRQRKKDLKASDDIEEELMRDDLFDYLDQYEEGEFEREQELTGSSAATSAAATVTVNNSTSSNSNNNVTNVNAQTAKRNGTAVAGETIINVSNGNGNNNSSSIKPFSHHIMYLPSYDSRRLHNQHFPQNHHQRRARSVDHLDSSESNSLFIRSSNQRQMSPPARPYYGESEDYNGGGGGARGRSKVKVRAPPAPNSKPKAVRKQSEPCYPTNSGDLLLEEDKPTLSDKPMTAEEQERRLQNKKKFKFQSTLRVQERKKIEAELTREARQREEERLREMEAMKRVEDEFQKKRAKEKLEAQAASALANLNGSDNVSRIDLSSGGGMSPATSQHNTSSSGGRNNKISTSTTTTSYPIFPPGGRKKEALSHQPSTSSNGSGSGSGGPMSKRQEPEGAPAAPNSLCNSSLGGSSGGSQDLRKELISASRKRNALVVGGSREELHGPRGTQELSEFRQEASRQYCDYRTRPGRQQSLSPAR